jgi:hypothetical protein
MLGARWQHPERSFFRSFGSVAAGKAAYRLVESSQAEISFQSLLAPHARQTHRRMAAESLVVLAQDLDWEQERLRVPERKAGHSTAYPLSPVVGQAILDYLKNGRPKTADRHAFFRSYAPAGPLTAPAVSVRAVRYRPSWAMLIHHRQRCI